MDIKEVINLCTGQEGKVFVLDASGNVSLVILSISEYKKMSKRDTAPQLDPEIVNRKILYAQMEDESPHAFPQRPKISVPLVHQPQAPVEKVDLREEVIDPSFDFDSVDDL